MQDLAERQTDILENNKLKAKLSAHMAAAQDAAQREDRASVSAARVDMVRHTKSKLREEEAANERAVRRKEKQLRKEDIGLAAVKCFLVG
jgi:hypothetical protein